VATQVVTPRVVLRSVELGSNIKIWGRDSSVGIVTGYRLEGRGWIPCKARVHTRSGTNRVSSPLPSEYGALTWTQNGRRVKLTLSPPSVETNKYGVMPPFPKSN
jgi:hypothetical protein